VPAARHEIESDQQQNVLVCRKHLENIFHLITRNMSFVPARLALGLPGFPSQCMRARDVDFSVSQGRSELFRNGKLQFFLSYSAAGWRYVHLQLQLL
jgi:hypothetical protein